MKKSQSMKQLSQTKIRKILLESAFDPKDDIALRELTSFENPEYCVMKATEYLTQYLDGTGDDITLRDAISLLVLARGLNAAVTSKKDQSKS